MTRGRRSFRLRARDRLSSGLLVGRLVAKVPKTGVGFTRAFKLEAKRHRIDRSQSNAKTNLLWPCLSDMLSLSAMSPDLVIEIGQDELNENRCWRKSDRMYSRRLHLIPTFRPTDWSKS